MNISIGSPTLWIGFVLFVVAMLALDLGFFHKKAHAVSTREAAIWTAIWIALAIIFNVFVWWTWGRETGEAFLAGYLIEKALSVDNLFVFYMVFTAFSVRPEHQHRLLFWGIVGALIFRAALVLGGSVLLEHFHAVVYLFGAILIATGVKMFIRRDEKPHPEESRLFKTLSRIVPTTPATGDGRLFVRDGTAWKATTLFLVLMLIELTDVVFAIDSILAIFAITPEPFIVFTSNIFAVMGMRSLYFLLASMAKRFVYLQPGLAIIIMFVGVKMAISHWIKIPVFVSLLVVVVLLAGSIAASLWRTRGRSKSPRVRVLERRLSRP